jgi:hypothetical protein
MRRAGGFSGTKWSPRADVSAFGMLLFEIVAGYPRPPPIAAKVAGGVILLPGVPDFVSVLITRALEGHIHSLITIVENLKANDFKILPGVDSDEVSAFVSRVETAAESREVE